MSLSEIRVNTTKTRTGVGTITYTETGPVITGIATASNFKTGSTNVHSTGVELTNINTGGSTATFGGALSGTTASFSGNVSIGGTLTYEDVTNIDSVGILTARAGIIDSTLTAGRVVYVDSDKSLTDSSNLTYNNGKISVAGASGNTQLSLTRSDTNTTGITATIGFYASDNHAVAGLYALGDGNNEGAHLVFKTTSAASGTSVYSNVDERLRITSTGRVLIGNGSTYSPSGDLHIVGDTNSNGPELYLQVNNNNTTDNIGALWFGNNVDKSLVKLAGHTHTANNTADFTVSTSAAGTLGERLRIRSDGKLQIGTVGGNSTYLTTSTNAALDIWGDGSAYPTLRLGTEVLDTEGEDIRFGRTDHGATDIRYHSIISRHMSSGASNYLQFRIHDGGGNPFTTQKTVLHLNGLGNMGLGTNSPNHYNNYSTITLNGATGGEIDFEDDGTLLGDHFCNVNGHFFTAGRSAAMPFIWQTHNGSSVSQRMQLTATGQLNIGVNLTQTTYPFSVQKDLNNGGNLAYFANSDSTYSQGLGLSFDSNKDIEWSGGSGAGGMDWNMGTRGYKWRVNGSDRALLSQYGMFTLDSGSQSGNSKPGIELKSTGYTGNITRLFQDSPNTISTLETTERSLLLDIDSGNQVAGSCLAVEIDGVEEFRFDPGSITYKNTNNTTRGTLIAPLNYHNNTNHYVDLTQWRLSDSWNILEVFGTVNPNSSGSGAYADPCHFYIYRGSGWDGAIYHWLYCASVAPPSRHAFPSGTGYAGNAGISAVWYDGSSIIGNKSATSTHYVRLLVPNANGSNTFVKNFRVMRRF